MGSLTSLQKLNYVIKLLLCRKSFCPKVYCRLVACAAPDNLHHLHCAMHTTLMCLDWMDGWSLEYLEIVSMTKVKVTPSDADSLAGCSTEKVGAQPLSLCH